MRLSKGTKTGEECLSFMRGCPLQRLPGNSKYRRKRILDAMPALLQQQLSLLLGPHALDSKTELPGDGKSKLDIPIGECVRHPAIGHELASQRSVCHQRDEGKRFNPLRLHRGLECWFEIAPVDIVDGDGGGVTHVA